MDPVANQLHHGIWNVKGRSHHTRSPVPKGRHGIEQMGTLCRSGPQCRLRGVIVRLGMPQGNPYPLFHRHLNQRQGPRKLRCQRHQPYNPFSGLLEAS